MPSLLHISRKHRKTRVRQRADAAAQPPGWCAREGATAAADGRARPPAAWLFEVLREAIEDQHNDWIGECVEVEAAYRSWLRAPLCERAAAYAAYRAALEREEHACSIYRELLDEHARMGARPRCSGRGSSRARTLAGLEAESRDG